MPPRNLTAGVGLVSLLKVIGLSIFSLSNVCVAFSFRVKEIEGIKMRSRFYI